MIFRASSALSRPPDVLVGKLIQGRVTYVHRRLWPALVKLAPHFTRGQLSRVWDEHPADRLESPAADPKHVVSRQQLGEAKPVRLPKSSPIRRYGWLATESSRELRAAAES